MGDLDPESSFRFSDLSGVDFSDCDLSGFDFTGADLTGADFTRAKYENAIFTDAINPPTTANGASALSKLLPIAWYAEMSPEEKRTFWACTSGWALDAMDVQMFSFALPLIVAYFGIDYAQAGLIGTVTLLTSALGGWVAGALSDLWGRVLTLQITIALFAVFAFLSGFAQSYDQLLVLRALMGLGFGGEWAAAAVLVAEMIRSGADRGKAVGTMQSGWAVGWGVAALAATLLSTLITDPTFSKAAVDTVADNGTVAVTQGGVGLAGAGAPYAWRPLFWIGLAPAALVFYVRRFVDESAVFEVTRRKLASEGKKANFLEIFSPPMWRTTILTCLLAAGAHGGYWAIMTWLPTFLLNERQLTVLQTGGYFFFVISGSLIGYLRSASLSDRIGRRKNFILFAACSIVTVAVYTQIPANGSIIMLVLGFPLGFFASSVFSGLGPFFTELFPTRMRGSGQGFAYNGGRGVAALYPLLVGIGSASLPLGQSIGLFALTAYGLMIVAAALLPENRGVRLTPATDGIDP
jgi:MFS family permease